MTTEKASGRQYIPNLKLWRLNALLSQEDLAAKAGVAETTIVRIEKGEKANELTLWRLAKGLEITPEQLLHEKPAEKDCAA